MANDWNYLKKIFMQKCSVTDVSILIETAFEAAIPTLYQLSEYTCGDIMKMRGGHTWGAAAGAFKGIAGTKRRSGVRRIGGCGRKMSVGGAPGKTYNAIQVDQFKFLYEITGTAFVEGALFKFFLFEVGKNFLINWMTLAYAAEKCDLPPAGTIWTTWGALFTNPEAGEIVCEIGPGSTHCASSGGHEIHVEAGCVASISWSGAWVPFRDDPAAMGAVSMWLEDDQGKRWDQTDAQPKAGKLSLPQGGGFYNVPGSFPTGTTYRLKAKVHHGLMGQADNPTPSLTINTTGRPVHFNPMEGCGKALGRASDEIWGWMHSPDAMDKFGQKVLNPWFKDIGAFVRGDRKPPDPLV